MPPRSLPFVLSSWRSPGYIVNVLKQYLLSHSRTDSHVPSTGSRYFSTKSRLHTRFTIISRSAELVTVIAAKVTRQIKNFDCAKIDQTKTSLILRSCLICDARSRVSWWLIWRPWHQISVYLFALPLANFLLLFSSLCVSLTTPTI